MQIRGIVHLSIVYVVWGSTYLGIRVAVRDGSGFPAFAMAGSRVFVAGLILLAWGALAKKPMRPTRADVHTFVACGVLLWLGGNGLVTWAEKWVESAYTALLVATFPLWAAILESILDRRRPTLRLLTALAVGMSGIAVLNYPTLRHGSRADVVAAGALLLAVLSWGIGSIWQKRRPITLSGEVSSGYQLLFGSFFLVAASLLAGEPRPHPTAEAWWAWGYLVVFGSVVAFTSFVKSLQLLPVQIVATYAYVNPVIAVILGWLILGERITVWTLAGSALVILGVAGVFQEQRRRRKSA